MVGQPTSILWPQDRIAEETLILKRLKQGEHIDHFETIRVTKAKNQIDISTSIFPIRNRYGEMIGACSIARDVTERKLAERERGHLLKMERESRERAEDASRVKEEFLATLSHELRTPLTAVLGWSRMLLRGMLSDSDRTRALETIERNANLQSRLINDLLDVSRIISGKLSVEMRRVDLMVVMRDALEATRPAFEAKRITVDSMLDGSAVVSGDSARMHQVFWNLLTNAAKFTPHDGRVEIAIERASSNIQVVVRDNGIGIKPEFLPHVFERFRQADGSKSRQHGGLGLGLAIVKHLVEIQGGSVQAKSEGEGRGASFIVSLPLAGIGNE